MACICDRYLVIALLLCFFNFSLGKDTEARTRKNVVELDIQLGDLDGHSVSVLVTQTTETTERSLSISIGIKRVETFGFSFKRSTCYVGRPAVVRKYMKMRCEQNVSKWIMDLVCMPCKVVELKLNSIAAIITTAETYL